ncbi:MAG: nucleotidyltransferase substrate binding protein [Acidobacteriota bacterium]|nr:nucleotidyltransferase substrate binding protein [Acidobacteriota bacterium]
MGFRAFLAAAGRKGEVEDWNEYRKMRNTTSHTYEESKADEVIVIVPKFVGEADYLVKRLQERLVKIK